MPSTPSIYPLSLTVNGTQHKLEVPARRRMIDLLRYDLGLTGTKEACSVGVCGTCTVLMDGRMVTSCLILALQAEGAEITTIEGVADDGRLTPLQESFVNNGGFQCGICTPGQILAAKALLDSNPSPSEQEIREGMMGNLCRCTGYYKIIDSIVKAMAMSQG